MNAAIDREAPDSAFTVIPARNGGWTLKVRSECGTERAIHSVYNPSAEACQMAESFDYDGVGILVVLGLGLGYHVAALADRFPSARLVVVEAHPWIASLCAEHGAALPDGLELLTGLPAEEALWRVYRLQLESGMPPLAVFTLASVLSAFPAYYTRLQASLARSVRVKLWEKLKYRKFQGAKTHIGLLDFGYYLTPEIERAIEGLGHETTRIQIRRGEEGEQAVGIVIEKLRECKPDFLLTVNHLGFDKAGALTSFLASIEMPAASWYVDSPNLIIRAFERNVSPLISVFVWDWGYLNDVRSMGFSHVHYLPLATDDTIFKPMSLSKAERARFGAEVGFVGDSMWEPALRWLEKVPAGFRPLVDELAFLLTSRRMPVSQALEVSGRADDLASLTDVGRLDFEGAVLWKATMLYRAACVKQLAGFAHRIHGDAGWRRLLGTGYRIGSRLSYYTEVPRFYNACQVNLNATSLQMGSAVNQRVFDVPACGALILTDRQDSLAELLEPGTECAAYAEAGEIADLVRFYLRRPAAARAIAAKGQERVLREHTYRHRLESIIRHMREAFGPASL